MKIILSKIFKIKVVLILVSIMIYIHLYYLFSGNLYTSSKPCVVKNVENIISFIKPKRKLVNYEPDTNIKFGPPVATSTIKYQQIQNDLS